MNANRAGLRISEPGWTHERVARARPIPQPLEALAIVSRYARDEEIYLEECPVECWYRVISGAARRFAVRADGRRQIVDLLLPGDFLGFGIRGMHTFSAEAIAADTVIARYPNPDLEEAKEAVEDMISDGRRASAVLARVRQLARKSVPERTAVDINGAVSEVLSLTRQELQRSGITTRVELDPDVPSVLADRIQVQQVVLNLVMNGIEAMRGVMDRPRVLKVKSAAARPAAVLVTVEDTGTGFADNDPEHIFETFFTTKQEGIGMGLSISRSIVQAYGGRLWASAGAPIGAAFSFTLPASAGARAS
jgi:signal transduction histidine kinase